MERVLMLCRPLWAFLTLSLFINFMLPWFTYIYAGKLLLVMLNVNEAWEWDNPIFNQLYLFFFYTNFFTTMYTDFYTLLYYYYFKMYISILSLFNFCKYKRLFIQQQTFRLKIQDMDNIQGVVFYIFTNI